MGRPSIWQRILEIGFPNRYASPSPFNPKSSSSSSGKVRRQPTFVQDGDLWQPSFEAYQDHDYRFRAFEALHVLSIKHHERDLARLAIELTTGRQTEEDLLDDIRRSLQDYTHSVDLLEKVLSRQIRIPANNGDYVPVKSVTIFETEQRLEQRSLYNPKNDFLRRLLARFPESWAFTILGNLSAQYSLTQRWIRFVMAFYAGASLLVPMIIMTFRTSRTARLITVSVATLLFAFCMTFFTAGKKQEIVASTAAYAAVMVVYIGTALQT